MIHRFHLTHRFYFLEAVLKWIIPAIQTYLLAGYLALTSSSFSTSYTVSYCCLMRTQLSKLQSKMNRLLLPIRLVFEQ